LTFEYETVLDGRTLDCPANYALLFDDGIPCEALKYLPDAGVH
jgi:hypothetical protein